MVLKVTRILRLVISLPVNEVFCLDNYCWVLAVDQGMHQLNSCFATNNWATYLIGHMLRSFSVSTFIAAIVLSFHHHPLFCHGSMVGGCINISLSSHTLFEINYNLNTKDMPKHNIYFTLIKLFSAKTWVDLLNPLEKIHPTLKHVPTLSIKKSMRWLSNNALWIVNVLL